MVQFKVAAQVCNRAITWELVELPEPALLPLEPECWEWEGGPYRTVATLAMPVAPAIIPDAEYCDLDIAA